MSPGNVNTTAAAISPPIDPPAWAILTLFGDKSLTSLKSPADTMIEKIIGQGKAPIFSAI